MNIRKSYVILKQLMYVVLFAVLTLPVVFWSRAGLAQSDAQSSSDGLSSNPLRSFFLEASPVSIEGWHLFFQKILQTSFIILFCYIVIFILIRVSNQRIKDIKTRHLVRKKIVYIVNIVLFLLIVMIWIKNLGAITLFLGVASAGIALALQEVILSMAGWFLILIRRPFEMGDRIELGGVKGDVIDIRLFQTSLLEIGNWVDADQSTGRVVNVPNSFVFKKELYNYNRGFEFIWNEIPILVTFESDWKRAKEIMLAHAQLQAEGMDVIVKSAIDRMSHHYMIYYEKFTPIVYVNIKDSGVELTLRYLTHAKRRRATQDELCCKILDDFNQEPNVNLAYPTYRIVKNG